MKVKAVKLKQAQEDSEIGVVPKKVTLELSVEEVVTFAHFANHFTASAPWNAVDGSAISVLPDEVQAKMKQIAHTSYRTLVGEVVNTYYYAGLDEAVEELA